MTGSSRRGALIAVALATAAVVAAAATAHAPRRRAGPYPSLGGCPVFPKPPRGLSRRAASLPSEAAWNQDVSKAPVAPGSHAMIAYIDSHGGRSPAPGLRLAREPTASPTRW